MRPLFKRALASTSTRTTTQSTRRTSTLISLPASTTSTSLGCSRFNNNNNNKNNTTTTTPRRSLSLSSVVPEMKSTPNSRSPPMPQTQYSIELPFAILDVRQGIWSNVIQEIEKEHSVQVVRFRNQFFKTTLTIYASDESVKENVVEALQQARSRVHEQKVSIPDKHAKARVIGKNGVRMDSVSRKFGVTVRYCEDEKAAYIHGDTEAIVADAALRLDAFETQVDFSWKQNLNLKSEPLAIDAIEKKHNVKVSSIPNVTWKPNARSSVTKDLPKHPSSFYILVGQEKDVVLATHDMKQLALNKNVDLAPWIYQKQLAVPKKRIPQMIGRQGERISAWKTKYPGLTIYKDAAPTPPAPPAPPPSTSKGGNDNNSSNGSNGSNHSAKATSEATIENATPQIVGQSFGGLTQEKEELAYLTVKGSQDTVTKVIDEITACLGLDFRMSGLRAMQLLSGETKKKFGYKHKMQEEDVEIPSKHKSKKILKKGMASLNSTTTTTTTTTDDVISDQSRSPLLLQWEKDHNVTILEPDWNRYTNKQQEQIAKNATDNIPFLPLFFNFHVVANIDDPSYVFEKKNQSYTSNVKSVIQLLDTFQGERVTMKIPRRRVGGVVGKSFQNINDIQDKCNVSIQLKQEEIVDDGELIFHGAKKDIEAAKVLINELIGVRKQMNVPRNFARSLMTNARENFLFIQMLSLKFDVHVTGQTETTLSLRGPTAEKLETCIEYIQEQILDVQEAIVLQSEAAGRVIGTGASNLKRMCQKHDVLIRKPPGESSNLHMVITGKRKNVNNCLAEIDQIVGVQELLPVPKQYLSAVIGKDFQVVKGIQTKHNVMINRTRDDSGHKKPEFNIWGPRMRNVQGAIKDIQKVILTNTNMIHEPVDIHESLWGLFIGTNGENIQCLEAINQVRIASPYDMDKEIDHLQTSPQIKGGKNKNEKNSDRVLSTPARTFVVRGPVQENVNNAVDAIKRLARAPWAFSKFRDTRPFVELEVPISHHGRIVGIGGASVTQVREEFEVDIKLPPMNIDSKICVIRGKTEEDVLGALYRVSDYAKLFFTKVNNVYIGTPSQKGRKGKFVRDPNMDKIILDNIKDKKIPLQGTESLTSIAKLTGAHLPMLMSACTSLDIKIDNALTPIDPSDLELIILELGADPIVNDTMTATSVTRTKRSLANEEDGDKRPPIVCIMGHVDHGKTTLLDSLRLNANNVTDTEVGGITQQTTAFNVTTSNSATSDITTSNSNSSTLPSNSVTFVDTPGHSAFSTMRESGINSTDILVLVVAADDGIMPQTIESGLSAMDMNIPIVVAITKCDIEGINPNEKQTEIENQLIEHGIISEQMGGDVPVVQVSGISGIGKNELIETLTLQSEIMNLRAINKTNAEGVVLEGSYTKGIGPIADVVVQWGTLKSRDFIVVGSSYGRVKTLVDSNGRTVKEATPSTPVRVTGLTTVPKAGHDLIVVSSLDEAREAAEAYQIQSKWSDMVLKSNDAEEITSKAAAVAKSAKLSGLKLTGDTAMKTIRDLDQKNNDQEIFEQNIIIVTNSDGGLSAIETCIGVITAETKVTFPVLRAIVGDLSLADIEEASESDAVLIGFNAKIPSALNMKAKNLKVELSNYDLIYQLEDELRAKAFAILPTQYEDAQDGKCEALQIFPLNGKDAGTAIGCRMKQGKLFRKNKFRLIRNGEMIYENLKVESLRILKEDVNEVPSGSDCGMLLSNEHGQGIVAEVGDEIECYTEVEVARV